MNKETTPLRFVKKLSYFRFVKKFPCLNVPSDALASGELKHLK